MAKSFKSTRRGITGALEPGEARLLRALLDDVVAMLEPETAASEDPLAALVGMSGADTEVSAPGDSAVRRLLPDAVRGDDDEALAFRRLTERSLREQKMGALRASALLLETSPVTLNDEQARLLAQALNDVRLVLADRLSIESEADAERLHEIADSKDVDDVESYLALVYNFVTWLQESLVQAMLKAARLER
ncbi:DUF2017 domain-containing protein [Arthrobacter agilis]|uniref:DUF2017 domain-containing protein n=1 Tax=Arthrobacter agilis TaxID=37921 RepID=UPI000B359734|nr:DUF2017 domain-containing protein [Arthrobacter agilis]OUM44117.1 hypothetical protein B8W74_04360 [Arthrobacter agilis]PPB46491.1 DUF2017 domain-containing protein [Arthrobacter agilis]TPV23854.1 DUF2017 domain-containing protein [Arthrobacter agilis]VDR32594.1 Domain of uncharacterised function (DUF2017) [Arthrobacter agilis]